MPRLPQNEMLIPLDRLEPAKVSTTTLTVVPGALPVDSVQFNVFTLIQTTFEQRPDVTVELGRKFAPVITNTDPPTDEHPSSAKPNFAPVQLTSAKVVIVGTSR